VTSYHLRPAIHFVQQRLVEYGMNGLGFLSLGTDLVRFKIRATTHANRRAGIPSRASSRPLLTSRFSRFETENHISVHTYVINTSQPIHSYPQSTTPYLQSSSTTKAYNDTPPRPKDCAYRPQRTVELAKVMLMRVGFEPTPFRTSDCIDEPRLVSP
jgi:hypothetical protein